MTRNDLDFLKNWFSDYCRTFYPRNENDRKNITLKEKHTDNVCENMVALAKEQSLPEGDLMLAGAVGLFHDIGRFPQYAKFRTFNDRISVNHGKLGAEILERESALERLSPAERDLILNAVRFHNTFSLPSLENEKTIFFLKLIRDADKLDILRIFAEYYEKNEDERASATTLGLPDAPGYSDKILSCIYERKVASYANLKSVNDIRLLHLSWVYDLNFIASLKVVREKDYIRRISAGLPRNAEIARSVTLLKNFITDKLKKMERQAMTDRGLPYQA